MWIQALTWLIPQNKNEINLLILSEQGIYFNMMKED
jgi:hypothetical protein